MTSARERFWDHMTGMFKDHHFQRPSIHLHPPITPLPGQAERLQRRIQAVKLDRAIKAAK